MSKTPCYALALTLAAALAVGISQPAHAETIVVKKGDDLQAAIDNASPGDTIKLSAGLFVGAITMTERTNLTIIGRRTKIDGAGEDSSITLTDCTNITFRGIQFQNGDPNGVRAVNCEDLTFERCNVKNTDDSGMEMRDCRRITIDRCKVTRTGNDGIAFSDDLQVTTDDSTVTRTFISQCLDDGIDTRGSRNTFERITIKKVTGDGVTMDTGGADNLFDRLKIIKPLNDGISVFGENTTIRDTRVIKPGADGIDLDTGNGGLVEGCKVIKAGENGIEIDTQNNTVRNNKVKKSVGFDIQDRVQDGSNTVEDNVAKKVDIQTDS